MTQKFEHCFLDKKSTASQTYKEVVKMQEQGWEMAAVDTQVIWMKRSITPVEADQKESYIKAIEIQNAENPLAEIDKKFEEGSQKELEKSLGLETSAYSAEHLITLGNALSHSKHYESTQKPVEEEPVAPDENKDIDVSTGREEAIDTIAQIAITDEDVDMMIDKFSHYSITREEIIDKIKKYQEIHISEIQKIIRKSNEREIKEAEEYRNSIKNFVEQINIWGKEKWKFNNRIGFSESTSAEEVAATMLFAVYKMIREKKLAKWSAISKILEEKIHNFLDEE